VAVRALEVVAVQVQLSLNTPALGGAFVSIRRPKSGADVVPHKAGHRFIEVHANSHSRTLPKRRRGLRRPLRPPAWVAPQTPRRSTPRTRCGRVGKPPPSGRPWRTRR